jgi:hypothetical protein
MPTCVNDSSYSLLLEATNCSADTAGNALCMLSPSTHAGTCLGCCCSCWCWAALLPACCQKGSPGPIQSVLNCVARAWCHAMHVRRSLALLAGQQCWLIACRQEQCSRGGQSRLLDPVVVGHQAERCYWNASTNDLCDMILTWLPAANRCLSSAIRPPTCTATAGRCSQSQGAGCC